MLRVRRILAQGNGYAETLTSHSVATQEVDVFRFEMLLFPINCNNQHWILAVINLNERQFQCYDSQGGKHEQVLAHLRQWLQDEHRARKDSQLDLSSWEDVFYPVSLLPTSTAMPAQTNGKDCGVFVCKLAEHLALGYLVEFTQVWGCAFIGQDRRLRELFMTGTHP